MGPPRGQKGASHCARVEVSFGALICRRPLSTRHDYMQATELLLHDPNLDHEYLPITGLPEFTQAAAKLILGVDSPAIIEGRVTSVQTISGTGANHLGALFLSRFYGWNGEKKVYLSDPTWSRLSPLFVQRQEALNWVMTPTTSTSQPSCDHAHCWH